MKLPSLLAIATLALIATTVESREAKSRAIQYSGYYFSSFERSMFKPVNSSETWWLSGSYSCPGTDIDLIPENESEATVPVFLTVVGTRSRKGRFGHLGAYDRELVVVQTVSCRVLTEAESTRLGS